MPFYDQETINAFAAAKGHQIWPFTSNTDDPAGDPAHPNETADFLRDRIWSYCQDVISYVRAYHPAAVFECLWPLDANQGKPSPAPDYRRLLMRVNLPDQWKTSSYGIKYFRCEGFDYDVWQKNADADGPDDLVREQDAGTARGGVHVSRGPVRSSGPADGAGVRPVAAAKLYSMCFWAFDQFCLNSRPVPLGAWTQATRDGDGVPQAEPSRARWRWPRPSMWWRPPAARSTGSSATRGSSMANYPGAIDGAASLYSPVDAFSGKPLETTTTGAVLAGDSTINVASTSGGFAATYGVLSIDDELIVYTGKSGHAVHRVPAWRVRDRRRQPQQRRGGEGEHGRGLHHRAPVGGPGHRERVGHRRRAQLRPEGRRGHCHRPQDVPGRRGVRHRDEGEHRPGTPAQPRRGQVAEAGQLRRPRHGA